jgi:hypothetical protein
MSEFDLTNLVYMASERSANLLQFWLSAAYSGEREHLFWTNVNT